MTSVLICTPCGDRVHTEYTQSLVAMMQFAAIHPPEGLEGIGLELMRTSILPGGRCHLAESAIKAGVSHTLWIDSDQAFPKDTLHRLLAHDRDIVGTNIRSRRKPYAFVTEKTAYERLITNKDSTGLERVYRLGFGLVLIRTSVFQKMDWPWFEFEALHDKQTFRGEDYHFCEKARDKGVAFWIDHDLSKQVAHVGDFAFMP